MGDNVRSVAIISPSRVALLLLSLRRRCSCCQFLRRRASCSRLGAMGAPPAHVGASVPILEVRAALPATAAPVAGAAIAERSSPGPGGWPASLTPCRPPPCAAAGRGGRAGTRLRAMAMGLRPGTWLCPPFCACVFARRCVNGRASLAAECSAHTAVNCASRKEHGSNAPPVSPNSR